MLQAAGRSDGRITGQGAAGRRGRAPISRAFHALFRIRLCRFRRGLFYCRPGSSVVQNLTVQVDLRLFYETFSDTYDGSANQDKALAFLDRLTELHALFHGKSGQYFTEMRRIDMSREESGDAGNLYRISFECLVTDYSAQVLFTEADMNGREIEVERAAAVTPPNSGDNMFDTNL